MTSTRDSRCTTAYDRWPTSNRGRATQHFPEEAIDLAWKQIPSAWVAGEEDELERMLVRLWGRRARLAELISACRNARGNPFRNWPVAG